MPKTHAVLFAALLFLAGTVKAQRSPRQESAWHEYTFVATATDSSAGLSSELMYVVGQDLNPTFFVQARLPFGLASPTQAQSPGMPNQTTHTASLGDLFLRLNTRRQSIVLNYSWTVNPTAVSGDARNGISIGRVDFAWNTRVERGFDYFMAFVPNESRIGNRLPSAHRYPRGYIRVGTVSELRDSIGPGLFDRGLGDSHPNVPGQTVPDGITANTARLTHNRAFETAYRRDGTDSLADGNGLALNPNSWFDMDSAYKRILHLRPTPFH